MPFVSHATSGVKSNCAHLPPEDYVRRVLWSDLGGIVTLCYCNSFFSGWFNLADFGELQTPLSLTLGPRAVGV